MNVGLLTGEYPPDQGGVGDFTNRLALSLVELEHQVHVITSASTTPDQETQYSGLVTLPDGLFVHRVIGGWRVGCWRIILELARDLNLDILNLQYQAAAYSMRPAISFVPRRRRFPVVVTFHDLKVPYLFPKAGPLRWWVVRALARRADGVIVTNREDELRLAGVEPPIASLTRIPIGSNISSVAPSGYDRDAERASWGIERDDVLLGYFGFLNESKGGEELIRSLSLLVEQGVPAHLLKIGGRVGSSDPTNQAYADGVERLVTSLGLEDRVHWTGYLQPTQVSASLYATDICVLPFRDGVSFRRGSLLACLAHGKAIITTRPAVALPQVKQDQTMVLVDPENPAALAQAVRRITADPALRARLERGSRWLASEFTWDRIGMRTGAFFAKLIGGDQ